MKWLPLLFYAAVFGLAQDYDVLIRNGKVVDGTGNPWRIADVGIRGGKVVAIGDLNEDDGKKVIDAKGLVVAPGFIDIHNHSDNTIVVDGNAQSMIHQGVTSMIFGEGGSAAPVGGKQDNQPQKREWTDFAGYFDRLMKQGISPNIGTYVGSSQIWTYVRGSKAGPPTAEELRQMQDLVREAMKQGALGVASSLSGPPGSWIDTDTLIAMCRVASEYGGIYSTHMRTEGQGVFESVAEAIEIGRKANVPVDIIHLKIADNKLWGRMPELISVIQQARTNGQQVEAHVYPYRAGQNNLASIIPPWAHEGGRKAMLARLRDPSDSKKIRAQILNGIPGTNWYNHYTATGSWEGMLLVSLSNPEFKRFQGKRMSAIIAALGGDPIDVLFRVLEANDGSVPTIYFHHSEDDMRYALKQPFVSIGSDGTAVAVEGPLSRDHPHPRYYGTFPRVLGRYVREEKVLQLEEAVRKMTSANAAKIGIYDRGLLRPGFWADVTIFNPATVIDRADWENPHQYAEGIEFVLVNGTVVLENGRHTGARPGKILYGSGMPAADSASVAGSPDTVAAEWVIRNGGSVRLAGSAQIIRSLSELPARDFRIDAVDLIGSIIDPKELSQLSRLANLKELFLPGPIFNPGAGSRLDANDELRALTGLRSLQKLHFSLHFLTNINVQDKGLAHLSSLTNLRELRLAQTRVKGTALAPFVNLRRLDLNYSSFDDSGMSSLAHMKQLERLSVRDTLVTDAGLRHLAGLTNLVSLDLYGAKITDAGVKHLANLKKLQQLNLLGATITDEGLETLASLPELRELNLYRSPITNAGLAKLQRLKKLASLDVRYTRVTRSGADELRQALPQAAIQFQDASPQVVSAEVRRSKPTNTTDDAIAAWIAKLGGKAELRGEALVSINLAGTPVSDTQILHLTGLRSLESLNLASTEIGDLGIEALVKLPALKRLDISQTLVTRKGILQVLALRNLEAVGLASLAVDDSYLPSIAQLTSLREVNLSYTDVTDAGLAALQSLPLLESLNLTATESGDDALQAIASLKRLKRLLISYDRFTDKGVGLLASLPDLEILEMARTRVTDQGVSALSALPKLRRLNLDYTSVTDKIIPGLPASLEELSLDTSNVTDASIGVLAGRTNLRFLNLYHTTISEKAYETLKAALANCTIVYDRDSALPTRRKS